MTSKILIIEDEKDLAEVLQAKLIREGFDVYVVFDGAAGLEKAVSMRPDMILLDIILPDMNGLLTLQRIREYEWGRQVKVIILSALGNEDRKQQAKRLGVLEYIIKTEASIDSVVLKVKQHLQNNAQ